MTYNRGSMSYNQGNMPYNQGNMSYKQENMSYNRGNVLKLREDGWHQLTGSVHVIPESEAVVGIRRSQMLSD